MYPFILAERLCAPFVQVLISFLFGITLSDYKRTKSESDTVSVASIIVISFTATIHIAEVTAVIVVRRAQPSKRRRNKN